MIKFTENFKMSYIFKTVKIITWSKKQMKAT